MNEVYSIFNSKFRAHFVENWVFLVDCCLSTIALIWVTAGCTERASSSVVKGTSLVAIACDCVVLDTFFTFCLVRNDEQVIIVVKMCTWGHLPWYYSTFFHLLHVDTLSLFLQCPSKELVKIFTKANMTAHHKLVGDLVFEVTVRNVEHILQVNTLPCCGLKASLPPRNVHI